MTSHALARDFQGPACLYVLLEHRRKVLPTFLQRNFTSRLKRKVNKPLYLHLDFSLPSLEPDLLLTAGLLSFYVIYKPVEKAKYEVDRSKSLPLTPLNVTATFRLQVPLASLPGHEDLFLLVLLSTEPASEEMHEKWAACIAKAAVEGLGGELLGLHLPCLAALLDLSGPCLPRPRSRGHGPRRGSSLRAFMQPPLAEGGTGGGCRLSRSLSPYFPPSPPSSSLSSSSPSPFPPDLVPEERLERSLEGRVRLAVRGVDRSLEGGGPQRGRPRKERERDGEGESAPLSLCTEQVVYHLCAGEAIARERRRGLRCLFCPFSPSQALEGEEERLLLLLLHMEASHPHFDYERGLDRYGGVHITVRRAHEKEGGRGGSRRGEKGATLRGGSLSLSLTALPKPPAEGPPARPSSEEVVRLLLSLEGGRFSPQGELSAFFLQPTGQRMTRADLTRFVTSSRSPDLCPTGPPHLRMNAHALLSNHLLLDEYIDLSVQEKQLMKLWNAFIASFPVYSDALLPYACLVFVERYGGLVVRERLRFNLLLHLLSLFDFGLLTAEEVHRCVYVVDRVQYGESLGRAEGGEGEEEKGEEEGEEEEEEEEGKGEEIEIADGEGEVIEISSEEEEGEEEEGEEEEIEERGGIGTREAHSNNSLIRGRKRDRMGREIA